MFARPKLLYLSFSTRRAVFLVTLGLYTVGAHTREASQGRLFCKGSRCSSAAALGIKQLLRRLPTPDLRQRLREPSGETNRRFPVYQLRKYESIAVRACPTSEVGPAQV